MEYGPNQSDNDQTQQELLIFISHRHADKAIADVVRTELTGWTVGDISIYQSSDVENAPRVGAKLGDQLMEALSGADVVMLVYTYDEYDWAWPMYECGIASGFDGQGDNRIIVLQCTDDVPVPLADRVMVRVSEQGFGRLATDFHKDPALFRRLGRAYAENIPDNVVQARARQLFDKLREAIPPREREERRRWDMMRISLDFDYVREIEEMQDDFDAALELSSSLIPSQAKVREAFGEVGRHLGLTRWNRTWSSDS